ncbi:DUF429 domain-containing protein [candidate division KSB1 bacterium]
MDGIRAPEELVFIGIDCAVNPRHVGLARGVLTDGRPRIDQVATGTTWPEIDNQVGGWINERTLIALDAPLGWPAPLGEALPAHRAGDPLSAEANAMFRRLTDDTVAERVGKRPLDIGADRIARTAHSALSFLGRLRKQTNLEIPLAWNPGTVEGISAIEVYPAGTLSGRGRLHSGYKGPKEEAFSARRRLINKLAEEMSFDSEISADMVANNHQLDAVLCLLAAFDFSVGDVIRPSDLALAKREGWIWVRARSK